MKNRPFPAYEGDQPFFFVSYSHADAAVVYPEMLWIHEAGFNLWYDDGVHIGTGWRRALAEALIGSAGVIFFRTANSVVSDYCLREIHLALDENMRILSVQLSPCEMPPELRLSISDRQALIKYEYGEELYREKLSTTLDSLQKTATQSRTAAVSRVDGLVQDELAKLRHTHRSQRTILCAVAALETAGAAPDDLRAQVTAGGGEVLEVEGKTVIATFDTADKAVAILHGAPSIQRAGMTCGDVFYQRGMVNGAPVTEARELLQASSMNEALIDEKLALLAGMDAACATPIAACGRGDAGEDRFATFSFGLASD